jgi:RNA polymerase sigma-70 factor (ECF subfamily)
MADLDVPVLSSVGPLGPVAGGLKLGAPAPALLATSAARALAHPGGEPRRPALTAPEVGDDREILGRLARGETAAFSALVRRYHGSLVRVASGFLGDAGLAEQVVRETWRVVVEGLDGFRVHASVRIPVPRFRDWLFERLVARARLCAAREGKASPFHPGRDARPPFEPAVPPHRFTRAGRWTRSPRSFAAETPEDTLRSHDAVAGIERALQALPAAQSIVVNLRDVEGIDAAHVERWLDIDGAVQRGLLRAGRLRLWSVLERGAREGAIAPVPGSQ